MTVKLQPTSSRAIHAARFAAELQKAMRTRKVSNQRLGEAIGSTKGAVANWKAANNLPRTDSALRMAEALDWPKLVEIARAGRSRPCERCGRSIVNEGGSAKRFCSVGCRDVDEQLRRQTAGSALADVVRSELDRVEHNTQSVKRSTLRAALAAYNASDAKRVARVDKLTNQLAGVQAAVDAMCRGCEPIGLCRDLSCALRPVSPLPMASAVQASEPREPEGSWSPKFREHTLARIRAGNAERWSRPGEHERQSERNRERIARRTPEEREAFRRKVSDARRRQEAERAS